MKRTPRRSRNAMTMHEVARQIGVSPMTVSRVLNEDPLVNEQTRQRVKVAIKELGYAPNPAARSLAKASILRIGLVYSNPSAGYLNEFLAGLLEESGRAGCQIVLEKCTARKERAVVWKRLADKGLGRCAGPQSSATLNISRITGGQSNTSTSRAFPQARRGEKKTDATVGSTRRLRPPIP